MKWVIGATALGVAVAISAAASTTREDTDRQAAALVAQLTLDEKADQLLNTAPAIPRLGIPAYNWWTESLHGAIGSVPTTNFPEPIGLAATFDEPLLGYFAGTPVYPFGYGISYTTFAYGPLQVAGAEGSMERGLRVTTTVTNTGKRAGEEVAQLYLEPPRFEGAPRVALRGFQRVSLQPGERKTITLELSPRDLSFVSRDGVRQIITGDYRVSVGSGQPRTGVPAESAAFSVAREVSIPE